MIQRDGGRKVVRNVTIQRRGLFFPVFAITGLLCVSFAISYAQDQRTKIRISNAALNFTSLPLLAAKEWSIFKANGFDVEVIVMSSIVAAPALLRGDIDYVSGVGPASISATLSGLPSRAVWMSSSRTLYWLMTNPKYKKPEELKSKKIGVTGLGGTPHVAFSMALDKLGIPSKEFAMVSLPGNRIFGIAAAGSHRRGGSCSAIDVRGTEKGLQSVN
jgi:ABC-type nitrate/sulfonate/bicarbonate transport system substrate-binding protein